LIAPGTENGVLTPVRFISSGECEALYLPISPAFALSHKRQGLIAVPANCRFVFGGLPAAPSSPTPCARGHTKRYLRTPWRPTAGTPRTDGRRSAYPWTAACRRTSASIRLS